MIDEDIVAVLIFGEGVVAWAIFAIDILSREDRVGIFYPGVALEQVSIFVGCEYTDAVFWSGAGR